ncbi:MAG TPA: hypothetical protein VH438_02115 [Gemmatimonadales bacterium]|jgi:hypothetical protein
MPHRFGKAGLVLGWLLIAIGITYLALGGRGAVAQVPGSLPRIIVGLVAVVVGSSIVRWAKRAGT